MFTSTSSIYLSIVCNNRDLPLRAVEVLFSPMVFRWVSGPAGVGEKAVVTLTYKILSGLYLGNRKVQDIDIW